MNEKRAQQEIAGFVIIVVLVVIAMLIFMVISLRQAPKEIESRSAQNALSSILDYTTECIVSPPVYESIRDLVKSCYENEKCNNLDRRVCSYLNQTLAEMLPELLLNRGNTIQAYDIIVTWEDETGVEPPRQELKVSGGRCNQTRALITGASEQVNLQTGYMKVRLNLCSEV